MTLHVCLQAYGSIVGLHGSVLSAAPLFVVYLATLVHVYALSRQQTQAVATPPQASAASLGQDLESGSISANPELGGPDHSEEKNSVHRAGNALFQAWQAVKGFLLAVCSAKERPLHFIKLEFPAKKGVLLQQACFVRASSSTCASIVHDLTFHQLLQRQNTGRQLLAQATVCLFIVF